MRMLNPNDFLVESQAIARQYEKDIFGSNVPTPEQKIQLERAILQGMQWGMTHSLGMVEDAVKQQVNANFSLEQARKTRLGLK